MTQAAPSTVAYGRDLAVERALTERARHDRDAFAQLYRLHVKAVHGFAYRLSGSLEVAEETTSATFERALRSIETFEWRGGGVRPWLYRIAANEVTEHHRRGARATGVRGQAALRALADADSSDPTAAVIDAGGDAELVALRRALTTLNPRYREVITLRYLGELSADDAAAALGCSKASLAVTLHRALGALRRTLIDNGRYCERDET
jgi:RNA polymerase sigma-70 factor (ECF subfamily)